MNARTIIENLDIFGRTFASAPRHRTQAAVDPNDARMMRRLTPASTGAPYGRRQRTSEPQAAGSAVCSECGVRTEKIAFRKDAKNWICNQCYSPISESIFTDNEFVRSTIAAGYNRKPAPFKSEPQTISDFQAKLAALKGA